MTPIVVLFSVLKILVMVGFVLPTTANVKLWTASGLTPLAAVRVRL